MKEIIRYHEIPRYATLLLLFLLVQQGIELAAYESEKVKQERASIEQLLANLSGEKQCLSAQASALSSSLGMHRAEVRSEGKDPSQDTLWLTDKERLQALHQQHDKIELQIVTLEKILHK